MGRRERVASRVAAASCWQLLAARLAGVQCAGACAAKGEGGGQPKFADADVDPELSVCVPSKVWRAA
jgi:hypothetical protein